MASRQRDLTGHLGTPVSSVEAFKDRIATIKRPYDTHISLYRGQPEHKELLPSLFRRFKDRVDRIRAVEGKLLEQLKAAIPPNTPLRPRDDWNWLSFGQHRHLRTRLLDWSAKPLIALFFAVAEDQPISPTVYVYHAQQHQIVDAKARASSPADIQLTRIMKPAVHSVRAAAQEAWHTVHRLHPRKAGGKMVIPLGDLRWHQDRLTVVSIDPRSARTIRSELAAVGVRHASVFGEFDELCAEICKRCGP
jgi:hypothetical protein